MFSRIVMLFGGTSTERHVSVASACNIVSAIDRPVPWFIAPNGAVHAVTTEELCAQERPFERDFLPASSASFRDLAEALDGASRNDVFFLALHGGHGENGVIQNALEQRDLAFTGSGSAASAAAFDKVRAKQIVADAGVRVTASRVLAGADVEVREALAELLERYGRVVVKPVADGSSIGLHHLAKRERLGEVATAVAGAGIPYLVEPFVAGTELTIGVVDQRSKPLALPPSEVRLEPGRAFDFAGKYLGRGTLEITPAEVAPEIAAEAQRIALAAHRALGCEGYSRTDVIAQRDGVVVYLETNTLPGLTAASFIPQQLCAAGMGLREFVAAQIRVALERRDRRRLSKVPFRET